jgi:hypothetical protein
VRRRMGEQGQRVAGTLSWDYPVARLEEVLLFVAKRRATLKW